MMAELIGMFLCGFFFAFAIMMIFILRKAEMDAYLDDMADFYDSEYGEDD